MSPPPLPAAPLLVESGAHGAATVTLNRPAVRNAFDDALIAELTAALRRLDGDDAVRAVVLRGAGRSFSAGGDLAWMERAADRSEDDNVADGMRLATLMRTLHELAKPTIAAVQGHCFAGAVGLVACCDVAIAEEDAVFAVSEVRLGLVPSTIAPYVAAAIGARNARRYFMTGERFGAAMAERIGLVQEIVAAGGLDAAVERVLAALGEGGRRAQTRAKRLVGEVAGRPIDDAMVALTARVLAEARAAPEGREGMAAFLAKRKPAWRE